MFEEAGARRSDENLRIAFDFDSASKPLDLTSGVQTARNFLPPDSKTSDRARMELRSFVVTESRHRKHVRVDRRATKAAQLQHAVVRDSHVRRWIGENGRPNWNSFPAFR